jgi:hypothetical protein
LALFGGFHALALSALGLPPYTGPVVADKPFPQFEAKLVDGRPFRQADLIGEHATALVFFRGRW